MHAGTEIVAHAVSQYSAIVQRRTLVGHLRQNAVVALDRTWVGLKHAESLPECSIYDDSVAMKLSHYAGVT